MAACRNLAISGYRQLQGDTMFSKPKDLGPRTWGPGNLGTWDQGTRIGIHCTCMYIAGPAQVVGPVGLGPTTF